MRLDKIENSISNILSILMKDMRSEDPEIEELSRPLNTTEELEEACEKLGDPAYKKKVVCAMLLCVQNSYFVVNIDVNNFLKLHLIIYVLKKSCSTLLFSE